MTIQITKLEVEALINQRLESAAFQDVEDVILQALQDSSPKPLTRVNGSQAQDIEQLFAPLRGLNLDFSRNPSTGRLVKL
jgi:hypothetical protein